MIKILFLIVLSIIGLILILSLGVRFGKLKWYLRKKFQHNTEGADLIIEWLLWPAATIAYFIYETNCLTESNVDAFLGKNGEEIGKKKYCNWMSIYAIPSIILNLFNLVWTGICWIGMGILCLLCWLFYERGFVKIFYFLSLQFKNIKD